MVREKQPENMPLLSGPPSNNLEEEKGKLRAYEEGVPWILSLL